MFNRINKEKLIIKNRWTLYVIAFSLSIGIQESREDVADEDTVNEIHSIIEKPNNISGKEDNKIKQVILKIIDTQSKTRKVIWKAGLDITNDYKLTGIGDFKCFFNSY